MKTSTKAKIIDPKKVNKIDYTKSSFKRGLSAVNEKINSSKAFKTVDDTKLHFTFSI
jgi:hypothetical protein